MASSPSPGLNKTFRKYTRRATKSIMKSHHLHIPKYDLPVRLRPWFLVFTCLIMVILAFLGFTNFSQALPLNDKLLHFICFLVATGVFYFIFDVEEDARRIWFWRHSGLIFTAIVCFFCGGLLSEFVQSMLPYKTFQFGDVVANLLGSAIGLYIAYYLERYYRRRREISRLYRPLTTDASDYSDEEDGNEDTGTQLLPTHHQKNPKSNTNTGRPLASADAVWDEREDLFEVGGDSDDEFGGFESGVPPPTPKITLTSPEGGK